MLGPLLTRGNRLWRPKLVHRTAGPPGPMTGNRMAGALTQRDQSIAAFRIYTCQQN